MPTLVLPSAGVVVPALVPALTPQTELHPGITAAVAVVGIVATGLYFWLGRR